MTKSERREVAAVLREWGRYYLEGPPAPPPLNGLSAVWAMIDWCTPDRTLTDTWVERHPDAALALCFAAAMVEAGDSV
jgi:hypothetical protein